MIFRKIKPRKRNRYKVDSEGCWIWLLHTSKGYARVRNNGQMIYAHRFYFVQKFGAIPSGLELDHKCKNKLCVNPDHLELVTRLENIHRSRVTKLSQEQLKEIKEYKIKYPKATQTDIAFKYNITQARVWQILNNRN